MNQSKSFLDQFLDGEVRVKDSASQRLNGSANFSTNEDCKSSMNSKSTNKEKKKKPKSSSTKKKRVKSVPEGKPLKSPISPKKRTVLAPEKKSTKKSSKAGAESGNTSKKPKSSTSKRSKTADGTRTKHNTGTSKSADERHTSSKSRSGTDDVPRNVFMEKEVVPENDDDLHITMTGHTTKTSTGLEDAMVGQEFNIIADKDEKPIKGENDKMNDDDADSQVSLSLDRLLSVHMVPKENDDAKQKKALVTA